MKRSVNGYKRIIMALAVIMIIAIFSYNHVWMKSNQLPDIHPIYKAFDDLHHLDPYADPETLSDEGLSEPPPDKSYSKKLNINGKKYIIHGYVFPDIQSASTYCFHALDEWDTGALVLDCCYTWRATVSSAVYCGYNAERALYIKADSMADILSLFSEFDWIFNETIPFSYDMDVDSWKRFVEEHSL